MCAMQQKLHVHFLISYHSLFDIIKKNSLITNTCVCVLFMLTILHSVTDNNWLLLTNCILYIYHTVEGTSNILRSQTQA